MSKFDLFQLLLTAAVASFAGLQLLTLRWQVRTEEHSVVVSEPRLRLLAAVRRLTRKVIGANHVTPEQVESMFELWREAKFVFRRDVDELRTLVTAIFHAEREEAQIRSVLGVLGEDDFREVHTKRKEELIATVHRIHTNLDRVFQTI